MILSRNNKVVLLLADIHDGVNYCNKNQPHIKISDFLKIKKIIIKFYLKNLLMTQI